MAIERHDIRMTTGGEVGHDKHSPLLCLYSKPTAIYSLAALSFFHITETWEHNGSMIEGDASMGRRGRVMVGEQNIPETC